MSTKPALPTDWATKPLPKQRTTLALNRSFSPSQMDRIRMGFIPDDMNEKWFMCWHDKTLHIYRSWSGFCIYVVHFVADGEGSRMVSAEVSRDYAQYQGTDDDYDAWLISDLIDGHLLENET